MKAPVLLLLLSLSLSLFAGIHSETIPYPYYSVQNDENSITLLNRAEEAFQARIDLIRRAEKSIEVEYYIFDADHTGKLITLELIKAAQRGVKVRMLIDKFCSKKNFNYYVAREVAKFGIEVKYYNNASLLQMSTIQFRNHRKLMVRDDEEAITGGRNIGDNYFNMAEDINYDDRDIHLTGPMVKTLRESFDEYYNDDISANPKWYKKPAKKKMEKARLFVEETQADIDLRNKFEELARKQAKFQRTHVCPEMTYSTDAPGAKFGDRIKKGYKDSFRFVRKTFLDKILPIDKSIIISSPYFIPNNRNSYLLESLLEKGVDVTFHTNSLASTDAIFISANLYVRAKKWVKRGLKFFLHDGKSTEMIPGLESGTDARTRGTHAKTHVYETSDYTEIMVGTYNFDNRSDFYNSEMAIFCKGNDELTEELKADLNNRMRNSIRVDENVKGFDRNGNDIHISGTTKERVMKMKLITIPSKLLDFLL